MSRFTNQNLIAVFVVLAAGLFSLGFSANWVSFNGNSDALPRTTILASDQSAVLIQFDISGMYVENLNIEGALFQSLQFDDFATTTQIGAPALPVLSEMIAIPGHANVRASIVSEQTTVLSNFNIIPYQKPTLDSQTSPDFTLDETAYSDNAYYPANRTELGGIGVMRGIRVVPVRVVPFKYNPVTDELVVSTRIVVRLEFSGVSNVNTTDGLPESVNPRIAKWYRSTIANYDNLNIAVQNSTDELEIKYLFICPADAVPFIQPLVDFRYAQGYGVEVRPMENGFNTALQFREYIHSLYVSDGLEYVMMIGDWCPSTGHQITPMYQWSDTWSDSWYTMIDPWPNTGNDYLADIAIGRIVYDNNTELQHQINKHMGYLTNPATTDNWAEHSLLVAHQEQYPQKYTLCKEQIRTFNYAIQNPIFGQAYGGAGATNQNVIDYLNTSGSGILNYRGHGSQTEWWSWGPSGGFGWDEVAQLTNANKLFVHFDVCCDNMDFPAYTGAPNGNCLAESFMKDEYAAVAINGAIIPSYTIPNHDYDKEFYKAIYNNGINPIGYASNFANITVYQLHGSIGQSNIRTYLWLGDSAIDPWTKTPAQLTVTHMPVLYLGSTSMTVTVSMNGTAVEDAMVCANNADTYSVGYTSSTGSVTLTFDGALATPGNMEFMVTCHNGLPYMVDIPVIPASGPYVACTGSEFDDAIGNNNGFLNAGENASITLTMSNVGIALAENVVVNITTADPYTTIIDGTENYGSMAAGAVVTIEDGFSFSVAANAPNNQNIAFTVNAVSGTSTFVSNFSFVISPYLGVELTPSTTPIVIPPTGGAFAYTVDLDNLGQMAASFTVWIDAVLPNGSVYGPIVQRATNFTGGMTYTRNMSQNIPAGAPAGTYTYRAFAGVYPTTPYAQDSFTFVKNGTDNMGMYQDDWTLTGWDNELVTTGVPSEFFLAQNHPNPFNPETIISFGMPSEEYVTLTVYNIMGQKVAELFNGRLSAGQHEIVWNAVTMPSGVYFYRLSAGQFDQIQKCILMK